jgi:hypothetical protein
MPRSHKAFEASQRERRALMTENSFILASFEQAADADLHERFNSRDRPCPKRQIGAYFRGDRLSYGECRPNCPGFGRQEGLSAECQLKRIAPEKPWKTRTENAIFDHSGWRRCQSMKDRL